MQFRYRVLLKQGYRKNKFLQANSIKNIVMVLLSLAIVNNGFP